MTYRFILQICLFWLLPFSVATATVYPAQVPVRVGVFDNSPIVATPPDKLPEGIAIDVLRKVAQREGWQLSYVADSFDNLISRLERGDINFMVGVAFNEARAKRFQFSRESLIGNWGMLFRHPDTRIESLLDLEGKHVALMRRGTHSEALVELARQFGIRFTPIYVDSYPQVLAAIAENRANAGVVNRVFAALHSNAPQAVQTGIVFNPVSVHYAAPRQADPALMAALDRHLAALKSDTHSSYYDALDKWLQAPSTPRSPTWVPWAAGGAGSLLLLMLAAAGFLRHQVQRQTGELQRRAELLQSEVTQREQAQQHLNQIAYFDALTRLPNREGFRLELDKQLKARNGDERVGLLVIDVDRLKNVNDGLGHGAGDLLLQQIALRLQSVLRAHDHLSRFGGDEFVVIVSEMGEALDAELVARRLLNSLILPIDIGSTPIYASVSIGIALYPDDADCPDTLLKHADTAMYQAKDLGGNRFLFYHAQQTVRVVERLTLDTRLRQALERDELVLHYQPIVDLEKQDIVGAEALVRWNDPEHGLIMPNAFIPAAEDTGLVVPLGEWVLEAGCCQLREWQKGGLVKDMRLAVNVSTRQFEGRRLVKSVEQALSRSGLDPDCLELEITENVMLLMNEEVRITLDSLRAIGVRLSLDDFGTGYSSLSFLQQLPFHALKIDRSFVSRIPGLKGDMQIIKTILALAGGLELQVIAEGIETREQYALLRDLGCQFGQGYLMGRPLPADGFAARLEQPVLPD